MKYTVRFLLSILSVVLTSFTFQLSDSLCEKNIIFHFWIQKNKYYLCTKSIPVIFTSISISNVEGKKYSPTFFQLYLKWIKLRNISPIFYILEFPFKVAAQNNTYDSIFYALPGRFCYTLRLRRLQLGWGRRRPRCCCWRQVGWSTKTRIK